MVDRLSPTKPMREASHERSEWALKAVRAAYYEAGRIQPTDYPPLPSWQSLPIELREAFIHVYGAGRAAAPEAARVYRQMRDRKLDHAEGRSLVWLGMVPAGHREAVRHGPAADYLGGTEELKRGESGHPVGGGW